MAGGEIVNKAQSNSAIACGGGINNNAGSVSSNRASRISGGAHGAGILFWQRHQIFGVAAWAAGIRIAAYYRSAGNKWRLKISGDQRGNRNGAQHGGVIGRKWRR